MKQGLPWGSSDAKLGGVDVITMGFSLVSLFRVWGLACLGFSLFMVWGLVCLGFRGLGFSLLRI